MGGNLERNRWMIIDDPDTKAKIAEYFGAVGRPYLADERRGARRRSQHEGDRLGDVPRRPPPRGAGARAGDAPRPGPEGGSQGSAAAYYGSVLPGVWSFQLAARARGIGSAWTTFHLEHEAEVAELLEIPPSGHPGVPARRRLLHRRHRSPRRPAAPPPTSPTSTAGSTPSSSPRRSFTHPREPALARARPHLASPQRTREHLVSGRRKMFTRSSGSCRRRLSSGVDRRMVVVHFDAGWSSSVARRAHNPKVAGSNPAPATNWKARKHDAFPGLLRSPTQVR